MGVVAGVLACVCVPEDPDDLVCTQACINCPDDSVVCPDSNCALKPCPDEPVLWKPEELVDDIIEVADTLKDLGGFVVVDGSIEAETTWSAGVATGVVIELKLDGDLDSLTDTKKAEIESSLLVKFKVSEGELELEFKSGSIVVTATITLTEPNDVVCQPGTFSAVQGATTCDLCQPGTFSAVQGATACDECELDTFSAVQGATTCNACAKGTFSAVKGAITCTACDSGSKNCECMDDRKCNTGLECSVAGMCLLASCPTSSLDCSCSTSNQCDTGLYCDIDFVCLTEPDPWKPEEIIDDIIELVESLKTLGDLYVVDYSLDYNKTYTAGVATGIVIQLELDGYLDSLIDAEKTVMETTLQVTLKVDAGELEVKFSSGSGTIVVTATIALTKPDDVVRWEDIHGIDFSEAHTTCFRPLGSLLAGAAAVLLSMSV